MASVPEEALCKSVACRIKKTINKSPKHIYRYGIFAVILMDLASLLMKYLGCYSVTMYVLMTQLACAILVFNCSYVHRPKKYCSRKRIAFKTLGAYYSIGFLSVLFCLDNDFYNYIVSPIILISVGYILYITRNE